MSTPNSSAKNRLPNTNWRAMASPPGMLVSASTHMPPTGTNLPSAAFSLTLEYTSGRCSLIQASCWACDMANTRPGWSSMSAVTLAAVRATLRTVSRSGHSHAESMWACPTAETRCAPSPAGEASTGASTRRAPCAVPGTSCRSTASSARSRARSTSQRRGAPSGSSRIIWSSTSMSCTRCHTSWSRTARSTDSTRYSGRPWAVSRSPSSVGRNGGTPSTTGLAAASTKYSTGCPARAESATRSHRLRGLSPFTTAPSAV